MRKLMSPATRDRLHQPQVPVPSEKPILGTQVRPKVKRTIPTRPEMLKFRQRFRGRNPVYSM